MQYKLKYELTVTLKPCMYKYSAIEQYRMTRESIKVIVGDYDSTIVAELTKTCNVHYHCLIGVPDNFSIKDKEKVVNRIRNYNKTLGRFTFEQVRYEESFKAYLKKAIEETEEIIGNPIVRDYFGILGIPETFDLFLLQQNIEGGKNKVDSV